MNLLPKYQLENWQELIKERRKDYEDLKEYFENDLRRESENKDLNQNNPLSQDPETPWNQYFMEQELKRQIKMVNIINILFNLLKFKKYSKL